MAKLIERLRALETVNRPVYSMPLIKIIGDEGLTNSQKQDITKAEKEGINIFKISREKLKEFQK